MVALIIFAFSVTFEVHDVRKRLALLLAPGPVQARHPTLVTF
jgi:hypothetical protein